jgi:hypothetical protein
MDELPPEIRALIGRCRGLDDPTSEDRARVRKKLALASLPLLGSLGLSAPAAAASSAKAGSFAVLSLAKWILVPTALGAATWTVSERWTRTSESSDPSAVVAVVGAPSPSHVESRGGPSGQAVEPKAPLAEKEARPSPSERPNLVARPKSPSSSPATTAQPSPHATPRGDASEVELLALAQKKLSQKDAGQALLLSQEHRSRFPKSGLSAERLAVEVLAFCQLGQTAQAALSFQKFREIAPSSPLRPRLEASCVSTRTRTQDLDTIPPLTGN